ncbi:unnamed protein product [Enterobius vermicularis]|uniref:Disintegrin domain-containing protein n=1 Tax=Enterobius vermicularis TaxID=51028 RepID=A0A0N4UXF8_ENTVE|nr:unnamed protein product [Enterobius vermicularis]
MAVSAYVYNVSMIELIGKVRNSSFTWKMSQCSIDQLHNNLKLGHLQCLLNKPRQESSLQLCGNGVVDKGEECDCGSRESCMDECCDPLTCTLRSEAQCASHQICCKQCKVLSKGYICRAKRSSCDVEEKCDGEKGDCPPDGYLVDGTHCGINGQCWKGNCSDNESRCKALWGSNASVAEDRCFERNEMGIEDGNCGVEADNRFRKCSPEDARCGLLHCQGGSSAPLQKNFDSYTAQFHYDGRTVNQSMVGMVADGSSCGMRKVCFEGRCLLLDDVSQPVLCPTTNVALPCSGHGRILSQWNSTLEFSTPELLLEMCSEVSNCQKTTAASQVFSAVTSVITDTHFPSLCEKAGFLFVMCIYVQHCTTSLTCICFTGWGGTACNIRLSTPANVLSTTTTVDEEFVPPLAAGRTLNTTTLLAILLFVGIVLLMLRRSGNELLDGPLDEKMNESIPENADRIIKFGNMPSYREEKRKRKKNKRVYDALHRINEASDERDSVSLKSRESGGKGSAVGSTNGSAVGCPEPVVGFGVEDNRVFNRIVNGSTSSILKNGNANRRLLNEGEIYSRSPCSEILGSPSRYTAVGRNGVRYDKNRSGYATDTELGASPYAPHYVETLSMTRVDISPTLSDGSVTRLAPTPLKLNNIGMLLKQLRYNDTMASEAELSTVEADNLDHIEPDPNIETSRGFEVREPVKLRKNESWSEGEKPKDSDYRSESRIKQLPLKSIQAGEVEQNPSLFSDSFRLEL